jgi:hypothetical protein
MPKTTGLHKLNEISKEFKAKDGSTSASASSAVVLFAPVAVLTSCLPGYLFSTAMFDMPLESNMMVYGSVTLATVCLLFMAYTNVADSRYINKRREHGITSNDGKAGKALNDKEKKQAELASQCFQQTVAFSLWKNNVLFLTTMLFLAFVLLKQFIGDYPQINYAISMIGPAACLVWLSSFSQ